MFQYTTRRMGRPSRWWRRRRLSSRTVVVDPEAMGALVAAHDPPAVFTAAEDAELAEGHSAQRTIEASFNRALSSRLTKLARRAPDLERRKVAQLRLSTEAFDVDERRRRAEASNRAMRDHGRHLPRALRVGLIVLLAIVDVVAYRAAVEVAFDTSDQWPAIIDSYLLALLSIGMVLAAMFSAERLKALHDARDRRVIEREFAEDDAAHARRVWRQTGLPALVCAVALLVAGAALRVHALTDTPGWFWLAVPAFSASALVGAFFVEYKWADLALDERDDLERGARKAQRKLRRADRRLAATEGDYRKRQAAIEQLWSRYEPDWRVQMEMTASRIAAARAVHPDLFHPLGRSVVESVHERIARGTTRPRRPQRPRAPGAHRRPGARAGPPNLRRASERRAGRDRLRRAATAVRGADRAGRVRATAGGTGVGAPQRQRSRGGHRRVDRRVERIRMIGRPRPLRPLRPPAPRRLRRRRPLWPLLLLVVPVVGWLAWRALDDGAPTEAASAGDVAFGAPTGERLTGPRCFMVVVDESASMADADATGARADAVDAAWRFLDAYGLADDRIGTTWFADSADVVGPVPATAAVSRVAPVDTATLGTGTNIAFAFRAALDALNSGCGAARPVIVLVSDGQASSQAQFDQSASIIKGAGAGLDVHLIAMNGNSAFEPVRSFWSDPTLGLDSIDVITSFGRDEVATAMAKILTLETGQQVDATGIGPETTS